MVVEMILPKLNSRLKQENNSEKKSSSCLTNNINFAQIDRVNYERQQIQYAIVQKNAEINDISMRIKTLSEYDPPVDVHNEEELLEQKYQELQQLDEILAFKTQIERE